MAILSLDTGRFASLLSVVVLLASVGCTDGGPAADGGAGGDRGSAGAGGDGGSGGEGGHGGGAEATALEICQAWCRNETRGPSCCVQDQFSFMDCRVGCYDRCEETLAEPNCVEARIDSLKCELALACDDFFDECQTLEGRYQGCLLRAEAEELGLCDDAVRGCGITEAECLSTYEGGSVRCTSGWNRYVLCAGDGFVSCQECVDVSQPFDEECDWPSGAGEEVEFVPQSCDTLPLPPAACDEPCLSGSDTDCGFGTYCEAEVCEADCVTNGDCARGDACSVHGRCLPTIFGTPLACSWLDDPPSGCGASCSSGSTSECPEGTFCSSGFCDAECVSDGPCGLGERCGSIGRCEEIPLPECSGGRTLDETFAGDRESLTCDILGVIDAKLEAELTAKPKAPLQSGSNTYEVQLAVSIDESTVNTILDLIGISRLRFLVVTFGVLPVTGTTSPSSVAFANLPIPCDVPLVQNTPIDIIMPVGEATWELDDGTTQELAVDSMDISFNALGLDINLAIGPDGNCSWDTEAASVSFSAP